MEVAAVPGPLDNQQLYPTCNKYKPHIPSDECCNWLGDIVEDCCVKLDWSNERMLCCPYEAGTKQLICTCPHCRTSIFQNTNSFTNSYGWCRKCGGRTIYEVDECRKCLQQSPSSTGPIPTTSPLDEIRITGKRSRSMENCPRPNNPAKQPKLEDAWDTDSENPTEESVDESSNASFAIMGNENQVQGKKREEIESIPMKTRRIRKPGGKVSNSKRKESLSAKEQKESLRSGTPKIPSINPSDRLTPLLLDVQDQSVTEVSQFLPSEPVIVPKKSYHPVNPEKPKESLVSILRSIRIVQIPRSNPTVGLHPVIENREESLAEMAEQPPAQLLEPASASVRKIAIKPFVWPSNRRGRKPKLATVVQPPIEDLSPPTSKSCRRRLISKDQSSSDGNKSSTSLTNSSESMNAEADDHPEQLNPADKNQSSIDSAANQVRFSATSGQLYEAMSSLREPTSVSLSEIASKPSVKPTSRRSRISKTAATMQPPAALKPPIVSKDRSGTQGNEPSSSPIETDSMSLMATETFASPEQPDLTDMDHSSIALASDPVHMLVTSGQQFEAMSAHYEPASAPVRKNALKLSGRNGRKSKSAVAMRPPIGDLSSTAPSEKSSGGSHVSKGPSVTDGSKPSTIQTDSMGSTVTEASPPQLQPDHTDKDQSSALSTNESSVNGMDSTRPLDAQLSSLPLDQPEPVSQMSPEAVADNKGVVLEIECINIEEDSGAPNPMNPERIALATSPIVPRVLSKSRFEFIRGSGWEKISRVLTSSSATKNPLEPPRSTRIGRIIPPEGLPPHQTEYQEVPQVMTRPDHLPITSIMQQKGSVSNTPLTHLRSIDNELTDGHEVSARPSLKGTRKLYLPSPATSEKSGERFLTHEDQNDPLGSESLPETGLITAELPLLVDPVDQDLSEDAEIDSELSSPSLDQINLNRLSHLSFEEEVAEPLSPLPNLTKPMDEVSNGPRWMDNDGPSTAWTDSSTLANSELSSHPLDQSRVPHLFFREESTNMFLKEEEQDQPVRTASTAPAPSQIPLTQPEAVDADEKSETNWNATLEAVKAALSSNLDYIPKPEVIEFLFDIEENEKLLMVAELFKSLRPSVFKQLSITKRERTIQLMNNDHNRFLFDLPLPTTERNPAVEPASEIRQNVNSAKPIPNENLQGMFSHLNRPASLTLKFNNPREMEPVDLRTIRID